VTYTLPTGIQLFDMDAGSGLIQITLKAAPGSATSGYSLNYNLTSGVSFISAISDQTNAFKGTVSDLNNWLRTPGFVSFKPDSTFSGNGTLGWGWLRVGG
jgi:hypothetical protein